ncbi:MAG: SDR family oxidoreductase [Methanobacteriota archaeon]|nr:MAG: SDR family oxidoreductase [Euryarchaeota archaeon]
MNSRSIGQNCSRSPRLNTGSIALTRATNLSRTSSVTRRESRPPISQFGRNRQTHETRRPTGGGVGLDGKVVVVTGGTGYLGSSVCKAFAETGATVVSVYLLDREIPYFEKVLGALGKNVTLLKADVMQPGEMDRVTKEILPRLKRIDVLVNTVGGYMAGPVEEASAEDFDRAMALNLKSTYLACKAVVPSMREAKRGAIVSVSSEAALQGDEESFLYSASKSGVNRLTESLARELKAANVRVNCVMPRIMDTPSNREAMPKANFSKWVTTDQVARVIRWLCSDDAGPITGAAIPVYGGP